MQLEQWYVWAVFGMLATSISSFVLRLAVEDGVDPSLLRTVMHFTVLACSLTFLLATRQFIVVDLGSRLVWIAVIQGLVFSLSVLLRLEAIRKKAPAFIVFSLYQFKVLPIIFLSLLIFQEWSIFRDEIRVVGILLAIVSVYLVLDLGTAKFEWKRNIWIGVTLAVLGMLCSASVSIISKVAVDGFPEMNLFFFMFVVNLSTFIFSLLSNLFIRPNFGQPRKVATYGGAMGLLTFFGFYAFLKAVKVGNLSTIATINSLGLLVPIVMASLFLGEKLKVKTELAVYVSIISLILIG